MPDLFRAAQLRGQAISERGGSPVDRPSQRRNGEHPSCRAFVSARVVGGIRLTRDEGNAAAALEFAGTASVTETPYDMYDFFGAYTEIVSQSAFDNTLRTEGLDVPLVIAHDQTRRIARTTNGTLQLSAGKNGLDVQAQLDPNDHDVQYIAPKLASGLIDEMSFAFRIDSGIWSPDYSEFRINAVDIHRGDVAIVGFGANPATSGGIRSALSDEQLRAEYARRFGGASSATGMSRDKALALLSEF